MRNVLLFLMLFLSVRLFAQSDYKLEVVYNLYATGFDNNEYLYDTKEVEIKNPHKAELLIKELYNTKSIDDLFKESRIDTAKILNSPEKLIRYSKKTSVRWNKQQVEFISNKLRDINLYKEYFKDYVSAGCCVTMHHRYREEYVVKIYKSKHLADVYTSRKSMLGVRKIPWRNAENIQNYNLEIDKLLFEVIGVKDAYKKLWSGKKLTKYLVRKIIDYNAPALYKLSAYDYRDELNELKSDFEVVETGEVYGRGRYIWNAPKTFYARLKSASMLPRVNLMVYLSKKGNTLYSRDSIKKDYKNIVERVQKTDFLIQHLNDNPSVKLDIYYFDNNAVNDYNIDGFNKNPEEWKLYDKYLENLKFYEKINLPYVASEDNKRINKQFHCGCNYRFSREFAEKAVFIEMYDTEYRNSSVWFLLPDDTVLLYIMSGEKVLNYSYLDFGKSPGVQYPCVLFDLKGNRVDK